MTRRRIRTTGTGRDGERNKGGFEKKGHAVEREQKQGLAWHSDEMN
jgi:hypothetical protein